MQPGFGSDGFRELFEELAAEFPARAGVHEQVFHLVDRRQDDALTPFGATPDEVTDGQSGQLGDRLTRRPRSQQGQSVRVVRGERGDGKRRTAADPPGRHEIPAPARHQGIGTGVQERGLSAGGRAGNDREPVGPPQLGHGIGIGGPAEKTIAFGLPK